MLYLHNICTWSRSHISASDGVCVAKKYGDLTPPLHHLMALTSWLPIDKRLHGYDLYNSSSFKRTFTRSSDYMDYYFSADIIYMVEERGAYVIPLQNCQATEKNPQEVSRWCDRYLMMNEIMSTQKSTCDISISRWCCGRPWKIPWYYMEFLETATVSSYAITPYGQIWWHVTRCPFQTSFS